MLLMNRATGAVEETNGGYSDTGVPIRDNYVEIGEGMEGKVLGVLYEPVTPGEKAGTAIVAIHSNENYATMHIGAEMARRGYRVLCGQVGRPDGTLDSKILDIANVVRFLRAIPGVGRVVLMGHSGGATLMSAYQRIAENGPASLKGEEMVYKCTIPDDEDLPVPDALMLFDANYGNGAQTLLSVDPCVTTEGSAQGLDLRYDPFAPENGYDDRETVYPESFKKAFYAAQAARNNRLIEMARERLALIEKGEGRFLDDEPFVVVGGSQIKPFNKLYPEDVTMLAHTKGEYDLYHKDGSCTHGVVPCLRDAMLGHRFTSETMFAAMPTTVREFLNEHAVYAKEDYYVHEDGVTGIDWDHTYNCAPGNVKHIHAPLLIAGMTGSCEYIAAEEIYKNAVSEDRQVFFVEAADHNFNVNRRIEAYPGQYGDTEKVLYDRADAWLSERF